MDRGERRRQQREERKATQRVNGVSKAYLARADAELGDYLPAATAEERTKEFGVLLADWAGTDQACTEFRVTYQRVQELLKRGQKGLELAPIREQYAKMLEQRDVIESQMLDVLLDCGDQERELLLAGTHIHIARGTTHRVPEELRATLVEAIEAREVHGEPSDARPMAEGGTPESDPAAVGQTGQG